MSANAPRSIDEYLRQLRNALAGEDTPTGAHAAGVRRFFGVFMDVRAYTALFYMLLTLATGIVYFTSFVVTGLALSAGFAILVIGIPRVIALGEGRVLEATTGERMPRRPVHPGPPAGWLRSTWACSPTPRCSPTTRGSGTSPSPTIRCSAPWCSVCWAP